MNPPIRPLRLVAAWLLCTACGCIGAAGWMGLSRLLRPVLATWPAAMATVVVYASLLACIGLGLYLGVRLSRRFLTPLEIEVLFRLPRRDGEL
jgi:hypothetical protein